jgi:hypothetical protein
MKLVEYTLPIYWASYLLNGDASGFDIANTPEDPEAGTREQAVIDAWETKEGNPQFVSVSEISYYAHRNDATSLGGDVATYTAIQHPTPREALGAEYEDTVGYNPFEDDPTRTEEEVAETLKEIKRLLAQAEMDLIRARFRIKDGLA